MAPASVFLSIKWEVGYIRDLFVTQSWRSEAITGRQVEAIWQGPTWLSSKTGLSGSESLPLPPLLPPRDKGLLCEGEPASEGGGLSVSTTSGFVLPMGTSVFPPLPQADTSSFNDSAGQNKAGLGVKARHHTPNQLGPWEEGHWELAQLLGTWL